MPVVIDPPYIQDVLDSQEVMNYRRRPPFYKRPIFLIVSGAVLLIIVISASVKGSKGGSNQSSGPSTGLKAPAPEVPEDEAAQNRKELSSILISVYNKYNLKWNALAEPNTPPYKALAAVSGANVYGMSGRTTDVQRFALATFYYSTNAAPNVFEDSPDKWTSSEKWLTNAHECEWEGIQCNANFEVTGIFLSSHNLSGNLPQELMFLASLTQLDLRNNLLYMEDNLHDVFLGLTGLQELLMDDNYIISTTGLPTQFAKLTSLQKITMSYNLLQGAFDSNVFPGLQQLTHLELESNYIKGGLPSTLVTLPNLTYLYLRRNDFSFPLSDVIAPGNIPKIFALWLDSNDVSGTIPTVIGELSSLASFSITNSTLTGHIPDEMGNLSDMRRCWLYDNHLTGQIPDTLHTWSNIQVFEVFENDLTGYMPDSICRHITNSSYPMKSLSADCDEVTCNCCTTCH